MTNEERSVVGIDIALFIEETLPAECGYGSFSTVLGMVISDEFDCPQRKTVTIQHKTLPGANGYWNIRGREHSIVYKKKIIATLFTEDCGLGNAKVRTFLERKGFRIG